MVQDTTSLFFPVFILVGTALPLSTVFLVDKTPVHKVLKAAFFSSLSTTNFSFVLWRETLGIWAENRARFELNPPSEEKARAGGGSGQESRAIRISGAGSKQRRCEDARGGTGGIQH